MIFFAKQIVIYLFVFLKGLLSIFLHSNPRGSDLQSMQNYLSKYLPELLEEEELRRILKTNQNVFRNSEELWTFQGFEF